MGTEEVKRKDDCHAITSMFQKQGLSSSPKKLYGFSLCILHVSEWHHRPQGHASQKSDSHLRFPLSYTFHIQLISKLFDFTPKRSLNAFPNLSPFSPSLTILYSIVEMIDPHSRMPTRMLDTKGIAMKGQNLCSQSLCSRSPTMYRAMFGTLGILQWAVKESSLMEYSRGPIVCQALCVVLVQKWTRLKKSLPLWTSQSSWGHGNKQTNKNTASDDNEGYGKSKQELRCSDMSCHHVFPTLLFV